MKVFVALWHDNGSGTSSVVGVYDTKEKAEARAKQFPSYSVEEYEVG